MPIPDVSRETYNLSLIMWHFVHISTLKKTARRTKPHPPQTQGILMRAEKESICPPKKSHIFKKKSFGSQEKALPPALLRVRQPPRSQPWCRYYTVHTHTRETFPCLQHLISTRRAVLFAAISLVSCLYYQF